MHHSSVYAALLTEKLNLLNSVSVEQCTVVSKVTTSVRSAVFRPWHSKHRFATRLLPCW